MSSEVTWINAASSGPSTPTAASAMPIPSTTNVPAKFCNDVGALLGHVRARPHGNSDVRLGERRCVVDAVAHHGNHPLLRRQLTHAR
jgi:hypothetical protein